MLATGFGTGLAPVASGTFGTLPGILIALAIAPLALGWQVAIVAALVLAAVPVCGAAERHYGKKDDHRIVADELTTFPLCVLGLPWTEHYWLLALAFFTHRLMDVIKPPPARQAQVLPGGWGIVVDDVLSSTYALILNLGIYWVARRLGLAA